MFQKRFQNLREKYREKTGYYRWTEGRDLSEVTWRVLRKLVALPASQSSRAGNTRELTPHQFHIPADRYGEPNATTILPGRGNNPFATVAETLWVCAGRNDIGTLGKWLPRARDYSDDGKGWDSGYGPRLRRWHGRVDQLDVVLRRLRKKPDSRQAAIVIWDPEIDGVKEGSKDYACNILVHFLLRDGKLNLYVTTRSNDIIFGVAINVFEWCFLGNYIAHTLGIPFGHYYQTGSSLHLYDWKGDTAKRVVAGRFVPLPRLALAENEDYPSAKFIDPDAFRRECNAIFGGAYEGELGDFPRDYSKRLTPRLRDFYLALRAEARLGKEGSDYLKALAGISYPPLVLSLLDVGMRRRREALWLCKGFSDLWLNTDSEVAATRYLQRLYNLNESYHLQQKSHGNHTLRHIPGRSPVQPGRAVDL